MSQDIENFRKLKEHINRVAKVNDDDFETVVTWDEGDFILEVSETSDWHSFLCVRGPTIFVVIDMAEGGLRAACEAWGYKYVG